jgi:hypothetical protein
VSRTYLVFGDIEDKLEQADSEVRLNLCRASLGHRATPHSAYHFPSRVPSAQARPVRGWPRSSLRINDPPLSPAGCCGMRPAGPFARRVDACARPVRCGHISYAIAKYMMTADAPQDGFCLVQPTLLVSNARDQARG